ncbi:MobF family relaxase [Gluconacetobacter sacchari]|uniref:Relaxase domain-containing protein n=2 Tax=Gluconacetobacter sacchari TaxID=92759 RepID=A0A7W4NRQ6_9PROT|nr:MobF family relaxase [Gluconacetobacter sacchari]MBB2161218.1 relaxase domain-containing protein [Gluconacetobacter sacchari]
MADHLLDSTISVAQLRLFQYYNGMPAPFTSATCPAEIGDTVSPRVLSALRLSPSRSGLSRDVIMNLLSGFAADGSPIAGKQYQSGGESIRSVLNLPTDTLPDADGWRHIAGLAIGRRQSGQDKKRCSAARRLLSLFGVPREHPVDLALCTRLGDGLDYAGRPIDRQVISEAVSFSKVRIGYIDLTWSADKSISVAWALATTDAERAMILQAHRNAVSSAMTMIETIIGRARKGKAGAAGFDAGHIGWIRFEHFTARPTAYVEDTDPLSGMPLTRPLAVGIRGDPQLHTHVIVPNVVVTANGRAGGLDLDRLSGRIRECGAVYQAFLARNLREIGVEVRRDKKTGAARLPLVPDDVRAAFSKRTLDGTDAARDYASSRGLDWGLLTPTQRISLLKQGVQGDPRQSKSDDMASMTTWRATARNLGWTVPRFVHQHVSRPLLDDAARLTAAHRITAFLLAERFRQTAVINGPEARVCAAQALVEAGIEAAADIDDVVTMLREQPLTLDDQDTALICVADTDRRGESRLRMTTALHVAREEEVIALARSAATDHSDALDEATIDAAVQASGFDFSSAHGQLQRRAMSALGTRGRLAVLVGVAGSGKTTLLAPLVHAWSASGRTVLGTAVAWRQAEELTGANIVDDRVFACQGLIHGLKTGAIALDSRSVVVLDELSLLSTVQLLELLRAQQRTGCRMVMIGDPLQCQAVEAGPVVDLLRRALGHEAIPELISSVRQRTERQRATALMLREGNARAALDRKAEDGTLLLATGDYRSVVGRIADLWLERHRKGASLDDFTLTVSAPTNADAREIARAIRDRRRALGQLGPDLIEIEAIDQHGTDYTMRLAVGDRIRLYARTNARCTDGRRGIIGNNGSVLEVLAASEKGLSVRNKRGRSGFIPWPTLHDPRSGKIRLGYGDVLSIDATQGVTSTEHIEAMPAGSGAVDAHRAYTQGSRHRETTWLVTSEAAERRQIAGRRALGDVRPLRRSDLVDNMARNMTRSDPRESALALLDRARATRSQSRAVQQATGLSVERAWQQSDTPSSLAPAVTGYHRRRLLEPVLTSLTAAIKDEDLAATSLTTSARNLSLRLQDVVTRSIDAFRDVLPGWAIKRNRRRALKRAYRRLRNRDTRNWRRVERPLPDEEIPTWGTPAYFALIGFGQTERRDAIGMEDAHRLYERALWRLGDARRQNPIGRAEAARHVERLMRLATPITAPTGYHETTYPKIALDMQKLRHVADPATGNLLNDLKDMEISLHFPRGPEGKWLFLSDGALETALAHFSKETVNAVCDRLLIVNEHMSAQPANSFQRIVKQNTPVRKLARHSGKHAASRAKDQGPDR